MTVVEWNCWEFSSRNLIMLQKYNQLVKHAKNRRNNNDSAFLTHDPSLL